jgi:hypothetical protein
MADKFFDARDKNGRLSAFEFSGGSKFSDTVLECAIDENHKKEFGMFITCDCGYNSMSGSLERASVFILEKDLEELFKRFEEFKKAIDFRKGLAATSPEVETAAK